MTSSGKRKSRLSVGFSLVPTARMLLALTATLAVTACGAATEASKPALGQPSPVDADFAQFVDWAESVLFLRDGDNGVELLLVRTKDGRFCTTHGLSATGERPGLSATLDCPLEGALRPYVATEGPNARTLRKAAVLGLARPDVARVDLELAGGGHEQLELRSVERTDWRAYAYGFSSRLPVALVAYESEGDVLARIDLTAHVRSLCSALESDETCPDKPWFEAVNALEKTVEPVSVSDLDRARQIIAADPLLSQLLAGRRYRVEAPLPWSDCDYAPIGLGVEVRLREPAAFEADWPQLADGDPYGTAIVHFRAEGVTFFQVWIDLRNDRVAGIEPTNDDGAPQISRVRVVNKPEDAGSGSDC